GRPATAYRHRDAPCVSQYADRVRKRPSSAMPAPNIARPHGLDSFPTRRSSDLGAARTRVLLQVRRSQGNGKSVFEDAFAITLASDRKSTRLNSSHLVISYAVFRLKKNRRATS